MPQQQHSSDAEISRTFGRIAVVAILAACVIAILILTPSPAQTETAADNDTFLPLVQYELSPLVDLPIPQVVDSVPLTGAYCPHYVHVNPTSGYVYVPSVGVTSAALNEEPISRVSVVKDDQLVKLVYSGDWPSHATDKPGTNETYITNLHGNVSVFHNEVIVNELITPYDPYGIVYNPVNDYVYVSDLHNGLMGVFDSADYQLVKQFDTGAGDLHELTVNPINGEVYAANWGLGRVAYIEDTETTALVQAGWGNDYVHYVPETRLLYVTHSAPSPEYPHNISILKDRAVIATIFTAARSFGIDSNPYTGYVYVTNPNNNTVTVLKGTDVIANIAVGDQPWSISVDPYSGYVFVVNLKDETVSVIKELEVVETLEGFEDPMWVDVDPVTHTAYVANKAFHLETDPFGRNIEVCDRRAALTIIRSVTD
ncbi:MAG: YncE family protein [Anaerolineae bacterium]|nr:YncE family protein [Anaerolineae bacterium]MCO5191786.1 YncE family protein [Anaerolineae bacterium]MCO5199027.1 YncE family protein [Anaerolineae bacterium]